MTQTQIIALAIGVIAGTIAFQVWAHFDFKRKMTRMKKKADKKAGKPQIIQ